MPNGNGKWEMKLLCCSAAAYDPNGMVDPHAITHEEVVKLHSKGWRDLRNGEKNSPTITFRVTVVFADQTGRLVCQGMTEAFSVGPRRDKLERPPQKKKSKRSEDISCVDVPISPPINDRELNPRRQEAKWN
jgi:hypothetical protein